MSNLAPQTFQQFASKTKRQIEYLQRHGRARPMRMSFPTKSALDAFTGWPGLIGFIETDNSEYAWLSGWKLWSRPETAYTPSFGNLTLGNGTVDARYTVIAGQYFGRVKLTFGTTTTVSGVIVITPPVAVPMSRYSTLSKIGSGTLYDASAGTVVDCAVLAATTNNLHIRVPVLIGSYVSSSASTSATVPWTGGWGPGDTIVAEFSFPAS